MEIWIEQIMIDWLGPHYRIILIIGGIPVGYYVIIGLPKLVRFIRDSVAKITKFGSLWKN